jgi:aspartokinase
MAAVEEEFWRELKSGVVSGVDVITPCSIIAAVGDGMRYGQGHTHTEAPWIMRVAAEVFCCLCGGGSFYSNTAGVAGKFFRALGDAQVNILAISQVRQSGRQRGRAGGSDGQQGTQMTGE